MNVRVGYFVAIGMLEVLEPHQRLHKEHISIDPGASHFRDKLPERSSLEDARLKLRLHIWLPSGFTAARFFFL